jgi:hypothetical protein
MVLLSSSYDCDFAKIIELKCASATPHDGRLP